MVKELMVKHTVFAPNIPFTEKNQVKKWQSANFQIFYFVLSECYLWNEDLNETKVNQNIFE